MGGGGGGLMEFDGSELEFLRSSNNGTFRKAKGQSCPLVASFNFIDLFIQIGVLLEMRNISSTYAPPWCPMLEVQR